MHAVIHISSHLGVTAPTWAQTVIYVLLHTSPHPKRFHSLNTMSKLLGFELDHVCCLSRSMSTLNISKQIYIKMSPLHHSVLPQYTSSHSLCPRNKMRQLWVLLNVKCILKFTWSYCCYKENNTVVSLSHIFLDPACDLFNDTTRPVLLGRAPITRLWLSSSTREKI